MFVQDLIYQGQADKVAIDGELKITYRDLQISVEEYRNYLYSIGIRRGDNVGVCLLYTSSFMLLHYRMNLHFL